MRARDDRLRGVRRRAPERLVLEDAHVGLDDLGCIDAENPDRLSVKQERVTVVELDLTQLHGDGAGVGGLVRPRLAPVTAHRGGEHRDEPHDPDPPRDSHRDILRHRGARFNSAHIDRVDGQAYTFVAQGEGRARRCTVRPVNVLVALAVLAAFLPSRALAADTVCWGIESFSTSYGAGGLHLQFSLGEGPGLFHDPPSSYCWSTDVVAVDVYRLKIHGPCVALERVTPTPLSWTNQPGEPHVIADLVDVNVEPNTAYAYVVRPACCADFPAVTIGYASTGVALICRGTLTTDLPWPGKYINPCDASCLVTDPYRRAALVTSRPPEADPYFDTATTLLIYGEFDGLVQDPCNLCNHFLPALKISSVAESDCIVAVEPVTWGAVKAKYR
jgi:hypothetical protein